MTRRLALAALAAVLTVATLAAPAAAATLTPEAFGAVGDGVADDAAALQRTFDAARDGDTVLLRAGAVYRHGRLLTVSRPGVTLSGTGATLLASDETDSALRVTGRRVSVTGLTLAGPVATRRYLAPWQTLLWLDRSTSTRVADVTLRDSPSASLFASGAGWFTLDRIAVVGGMADGVHLTGGSHHGVVRDVTTTGTGDDGVAVVSYRTDPAASTDLRLSRITVNGTTWGRGVSVVGGERVTWRNVSVTASSAAAVYVAAEPEWDTRGVSGVSFTDVRIRRANTEPTVDHGAVMVYAGRADAGVDAVSLTGVKIWNTRGTASTNVAVRDEHGIATRIAFSDLAIVCGPASAVDLPSLTGTNGPFTLTRVSRTC